MMFITNRPEATQSSADLCTRIIKMFSYVSSLHLCTTFYHHQYILVNILTMQRPITVTLESLIVCRSLLQSATSEALCNI